MGPYVILKYLSFTHLYIFGGLGPIFSKIIQFGPSDPIFNGQWLQKMSNDFFTPDHLISFKQNKTKQNKINLKFKEK